LYDASDRPDAPPAPTARSRTARRKRRRNIWLTASISLIILGIAGSVVAAQLVAQTDRHQTRTTFTAAAANVAATLTLALQHEEDLVVSARAFIVGNPNATQLAFARWTLSVEALARYPELEGGGEVVLVPASGLAAFVARRKAEPASTLLTPGPFVVLPAGRRPFYCFVTLTLARQVRPTTAVPSGFDYCALKTALRTAFLAARDSGRNAYLPYTSGANTILAVEAPVYSGGAVPSTLAARRHAFLGAFGTTVVPKVVLDTALRGHADIAVEFRNGSESSPVIFRAGVSPHGAQTTLVPLGYGWTMRASGKQLSSGTLSDSKALILLVAGSLVSVLVGLLVLVLGTGRARALSMVREKTRVVSHQALHDALTGLPNRALVLDRCERMLARARRDPSIVAAALYVDIDRFKHVNDSFGHAAGDQVLRTVAQRLRDVVRDQDTVGRLGGDEFIVLLESATRQAPPDLVAERLIEVMREPVVLEDGETTFSVSIGIAIGLRPSADELLRDADLALYTAKASGKDRAVLFQASMQSTAKGRLQLEADLDLALEREQLFLLYQPIVDLESRQIVGVEALIRWRHPLRGVVAPEDFIPLAEETGRIVAIGAWVLEEACRQAAAWDAEGHPLGMSVNVSAYQLDRDGFPQEVQRVLQSSRIAPSRLTLEITETALMRDVAAASKRLKKIKALGVRVAIDDFGTGSSSLAYLREFSADSLKIDRTFIAGITNSKESAAIIHALVELGKLLGIETLAEGIEDPDQLVQLQHERCDRGQGFLFAHPSDAATIERLLAGEPAAPVR
jgi:diguanylate cyclase (GGDEF)-like protein